MIRFENNYFIFKTLIAKLNN